MHTNARVAEVKEGAVLITTPGPDGTKIVHEVPSGMTLWSTGIGKLEMVGDGADVSSAMQPFTKRMVEKLPNQYHSKAVQVDGYLRVEGAPHGSIYAIGDASTVCHSLFVNRLTPP